MMPDIYVRWYDDYGNSHNSPVYFVDSVRDRFLVVDEDKNFRWVSTNDCELLKEMKHWVRLYLERRIAIMIDFIVKLEDMLRLSGYKDWEIRYLPKEKAYRLKLDGDTILMREVTRKEK